MLLPDTAPDTKWTGRPLSASCERRSVEREGVRDGLLCGQCTGIKQDTKLLATKLVPILMYIERCILLEN